MPSIIAVIFVFGEGGSCVNQNNYIQMRDKIRMINGKQKCQRNSLSKLLSK